VCVCDRRRCNGSAENDYYNQEHRHWIFLSLFAVRRMSIPISGVRAISLLKAISVSCENSRPLELVFGLEPILKLTPRQAAAFQINFVSPSPNLAVIYCVARRGIFYASLNGACVKLQRLTFLAFRCHTRVLSFRSRLFSLSARTPRHLRPTGPDRGWSGLVATMTASLVQNRKKIPPKGWDFVGGRTLI
jgi:hypothetical protein